MSLATSDVPFFAILLIALVESFNVTNLFNSWTQILFFWRLGKNLLLLLLWACDTLFPDIGPTPVNWHFLDIEISLRTYLYYQIWITNILKSWSKNEINFYKISLFFDKISSFQCVIKNWIDYNNGIIILCVVDKW